MARAVTYAQQTHDSPNPLMRFAHQARYKVSLDLANRLLPRDGTMVDFGAGEGTFLHRFGTDRADARLVAIEPYAKLRYSNFKHVGDLADLEPASVDVVGAFETLEHLSDADIARFLSCVRTVLKPGGKLLVTVPIVYGPILPLKAVSGAVLFRRWGDLSLGELATATMGIPIARPAERLRTHKGFDFRWLDRQISASFTMLERSFSPFSFLPWWSNSQAIFIAGLP